MTRIRAIGLNTWDARRQGPFFPRERIKVIRLKLIMLLYGYLLMASDLLLILCGATMFWFSPRLKRHWLLGYGSPRSMVNDATWQSANRFAGPVLSLLALIVMSLQVSIWPLVISDDKAQALSVAVLLALPFFVMYLTEKYLARVFKN